MKYLKNQSKSKKKEKSKPKKPDEDQAPSKLNYSPSMEEDRNAKVKEDLSGKFKMPYDFYGRVL